MNFKILFVIMGIHYATAEVEVASTQVLIDTITSLLHSASAVVAREFICDSMKHLGVTSNPEKVRFYLITSPSEKIDITHNSKEILKANGCDGACTVSIDGFLSNATAPMSKTVPYLSKLRFQTSTCQILVDHSELTGSKYKFQDPTALSYLYSCIVEKNVPIIAEEVAKFTHTVWGLRSVAITRGSAGEFTQKHYNAAYSLIVGMDNAGPCYQTGSICQPISRALTSKDATQVVNLHTDMGELGTRDRSGTVDIFVNGAGGPVCHQPGCPRPSESPTIIEGNVLGTCDHWYSFLIYCHGLFKNLYVARCDASKYRESDCYKFSPPAGYNASIRLDTLFSHGMSGDFTLYSTEILQDVNSIIG